MMPNQREKTKRIRLQKLMDIKAKLLEVGDVPDKNKLISMMIVEHGISKKTAVEEFEAVMNYDA